MCQVKCPFLVSADGAGLPAIPASSIPEARRTAAALFEQDGEPRIIYSAVEITEREPAPVKFRAVDGMKEAR